MSHCLTMELRQTEESITELVQQYKSVCSRPLAIERNNNNNNNISCEHNVKPPLPKWDDSLLSTSPERTKDHNVDTPNTTSNISVRDLYKVLIHIRDCLVVIDPKIKKIRSRLDMKDPITGYIVINPQTDGYRIYDDKEEALAIKAKHKGFRLYPVHGEFEPDQRFLNFVKFMTDPSQ